MPKFVVSLRQCVLRWGRPKHRTLVFLRAEIVSTEALECMMPYLPTVTPPLGMDFHKTASDDETASSLSGQTPSV